MTDYKSGDHNMFSRLFSTGNKTVPIIAAVVLAAVIVVSVGYTIHKLTAPKRSEVLAAGDVRFKCMQCKKEFGVPPKEVRKLSSGQTRGLILDCRLCGASGSALRMRQCTECEKYFVLQSARAMYEARKVGKEADLRGIQEICPYCKADIFEIQHKRMMQGREDAAAATTSKENTRTRITVTKGKYKPPAAVKSSPAPAGAADVPIQELEWRGKGKGFGEWGQTKDGFFGISAPVRILETWKWRGARVEKELTAQLPRLLDVIVLPDGRYVACVYPGSDYASWPLVLASLASKEPIKKWEPPAGWNYRHTRGVSRNRKFAALILKEKVDNPDRNRDRPRFRVGLVDISKKELRWVGELVAKGILSGYLTIRQIAVSDDGKYIAIGGWDNSLALVDASLRKVLWIKRPPKAGTIQYVVFSSDGSKVFGAGSSGYVFVLKTKDGTVLRRWCATETGQPIYGHRISCLAISPDDSWIAVGTGPEGQVYLWDVTSSDERPTVLPHGLITTLVVCFSPDSRHLASAAGGMIKVWRVKR